MAIKMKQKLILKECETCNRTYNLKETGTTESLCTSCNDKLNFESRRKDALRKSLNRDDRISSNIERLSGIDES